MKNDMKTKKRTQTLIGMLFLAATMCGLKALPDYEYIPYSHTPEGRKEYAEIRRLKRKNKQYEAQIAREIEEAKQRALRKKPLNTLEDPITQEFIDYNIEIESHGDANKDSPAGARGLMQIMPARWADQTKKLYGKVLSFDQAYDSEINKKVGIAILREDRDYLSKKIPGWRNMSIERQQDLIAAAYNGGAHMLVAEGSIYSMAQETISHVEKLRKLRNRNKCD